MTPPVLQLVLVASGAIKSKIKKQGFKFKSNKTSNFSQVVVGQSYLGQCTKSDKYISLNSMIVPRSYRTAFMSFPVWLSESSFCMHPVRHEMQNHTLIPKYLNVKTPSSLHSCMCSLLGVACGMITTNQSCILAKCFFSFHPSYTLVSRLEILSRCLSFCLPQKV